MTLPVQRLSFEVSRYPITKVPSTRRAVLSGVERSDLTPCLRQISRHFPSKRISPRMSLLTTLSPVRIDWTHDPMNGSVNGVKASPSWNVDGRLGKMALRTQV